MSFKDLSKKATQAPKSPEANSPQQSPATKESVPVQDHAAHSPKKS